MGPFILKCLISELFLSDFLRFVHVKMKKKHLNAIKWNPYKFLFLNKIIFFRIIWKTQNSYYLRRSDSLIAMNVKDFMNNFNAMSISTDVKAQNMQRTPKVFFKDVWKKPYMI